MLLLIETWSPACSCVSDCTSCSIDEARLGKPLLDPGERQRQRGALSLQPARELGDERARHRRVRARHVRDHQDQALRIAARRPPSSGRPRRRRGRGRSCRPRSRAPTRRRFSISARRSMIGNRPQLAQLERRHRLVGGDEAATGSRRRRGRRRARSPRARGRRRAAARPTARAPGAAARGCSPWAGAAWPCGSALRSGRSCRAAIPPAGVMRRFAVTAAVSRSQTSIRTRFVLGEPRQQPVGRAARRQPVRGREALAVLLHLVGAEQLRPQRRLFVGVFPERIGATEARRDREQSFENRPLADLQIGNPLRYGSAHGGSGIADVATAR